MDSSNWFTTPRQSGSESKANEVALDIFQTPRPDFDY